MTDTTTAAPAADPAPPKGSDAATGGALTGLRLPQLQAIATQLGVKGTSKMRKGDLLEAIRSHQGGGAGRAPAHRPPVERLGERGTGAPAEGGPTARRSRRATSAGGPATAAEPATSTQETLPVQQPSDERPAREDRQRERPQREDRQQGGERQQGERTQQGDRPQREDRQQGGERQQASAAGRRPAAER